MMMVAATPFTGLLELFVLVPLGIAFGILGAECAGAYRRRPKRVRRS